MDKTTHPTLDIIRKTLESRGFDVEKNNSGISVSPDSIGIPGDTMDIYTLKKNPEHIRARLGKKSTKDFRGSDEVAAICLHSLSFLEYTRSKLSDGLLGVARIGKFYYAGRRNETRYYYASVTPAEETEEDVLRRMLVKKTLNQLNGVDSKFFRKSLDALGLSRSSIVRLALTRIFRDSTDTEEFLFVLSQQADRIVCSEEWKTVRELTRENRVPFLSNIVLILWEEISRIYMKKAWETLHD